MQVILMDSLLLSFTYFDHTISFCFSQFKISHHCWMQLFIRGNVCLYSHKLDFLKVTRLFIFHHLWSLKGESKLINNVYLLFVLCCCMARRLELNVNHLVSSSPAMSAFNILLFSPHCWLWSWTMKNKLFLFPGFKICFYFRFWQPFKFWRKRTLYWWGGSLLNHG